MAYASQTDIETIYGDDALYMARRDGAIDADAVARALDGATGEIDSHIYVRYDLPLTFIPDLLTRYCVDIALYMLAASADVMSETLRQRYEDAIAQLRRIADGKAALVFPVDPDADTGDDDSDGGTAGKPVILVEGPERQFTRDKMRGL